MPASKRMPVVRLSVGAEPVRRPDTLTVEEPLEIRVDGQPLAVTMRTPGSEIDLTLGFLYTEGIISAASDVVTAKLCQDTPNVAEVVLDHRVPSPAPTRNFYTTSSCGVCGKASIDSVRTHSHHDISTDSLTVHSRLLADLPASLQAAQKSFARTGGLHAAGLFSLTGQLVVAREDVGRHNAVDKVIGYAFAAGLLPLRGHILLVSGRASFELTQKAWMAGIPLLAAVSAPSSLAVDLANEAGMTLVGFLRGDSMNVYSRPDRIQG